MKLWLDDERPAPDDTWTVAKTAAEAILLLETQPITIASLDHDLGEDKSGYTVALHMASHELWPSEEVRVYSHNPVGARNICGIVDRYGPYETFCKHQPYGL